MVTTAASTSSHPGVRGRAVRAEGRRSDALAVGILVCIAFAVFGLPSALGHPVVPGDDLTQNLPLRELVGRQLSSGHLPLLDPYIWSGAPLLAGWNAGAAYPLTWLFAVLPGSVAWAVNLVVAGSVAGAGCFAFLRASGIGVVASWLGGLTYAYGGAMAAQVTHIGLYIGMSWVPVALLATNRLTRGHGATADGHGATAGWLGATAGWLGATAGWCAVLGASVGLVVLSGEPRAVADAAVVLVIYALWRVRQLSRVGRLDRLRSARAAARRGSLAVGAGWVLGAAVGAVQLVPGLEAIDVSQRSGDAAYLFAAGSLPVRWLLLMGVPDLLGGSGSLGQPTFFATYSLTEVTGYAGVLSLVAAFALAGRAVSRRTLPLGGWPEWGVWYVVGAAGIVLALGSHTPLWHLLVRLPLFDGQRLQSRSILVTDLALAVLLAYWADGWLRRARGASTAERLAGTIPAVAVAAVAGAGLADGPALAEWMGVPATAALRAARLGPWLVPSLLLAAGALVLLWWGGRPGPRTRRALVVSLVVGDLVMFALSSVVAVGARGSAGGAGEERAAHQATTRPDAGSRAAGTVSSLQVRPISALHLPGRFAVYDPGLLHSGELRALGAPDSNVLTGTFSVQGYGSIVQGTYARATGTHGLSGGGQDVFAPDAASDGVLDSLSTSDVLAPSASFGRATRGPAQRAAAAPARTPGAREAASGRPATWFLGTPRPVTSVALGVSGAVPAVPGAAPGARLRVGLLDAKGHVTWAVGVSSHDRTWHASWPVPVTAVAVTASVSGVEGRVLLGAPEVGDGGAGFVLDGVLQRAITAPHFAYAGRDGSFAVFADRRAAPPLRLVLAPADAGGVPTNGASVERLAGPRLAPTAASVDSPHGAEVVRAVADVPGWHAEWRPSGSHAAVSLPVKAFGVVQGVDVPPGRGVVTWSYEAPGLLLGASVSAAGVLVLMGLGALGALGLRRRSRARARAGHGRRAGAPVQGGTGAGGALTSS